MRSTESLSTSRPVLGRFAPGIGVTDLQAWGSTGNRGRHPVTVSLFWLLIMGALV
jgi:hypothetical protein